MIPPLPLLPVAVRAFRTFPILARGDLGILMMVMTLAGCETQTTTEVIPIERIEVQPDSASLEVGSTLQLQVRLVGPQDVLLSDRPVDWSTNDPEQAQVGATGLVTALSQGTVTVTATSEGRSGNSTITVVPIPVASVTLTPSSAVLAVGDTLRLEITARDRLGNILTGREVDWTSSSTSRATVSSWGMVAGFSPGAVTISATSEGQTDRALIEVVDRSGAGPPLGVGFGDAQFAVVPVGRFLMGSANGRGDERPRHEVYISAPFRMQRTEITQAQWEEITGRNPSAFPRCGACPVANVSWDDIQKFLTTLNGRFPGRSYRLPTEAEWEYAARAGTTGDFGGTGVPHEMGWLAGGDPQPVAGKLPNAWGLYDMHGNVAEWVQDWYSASYYATSPSKDPPGPEDGTHRVVRGGWTSGLNARSAARLLERPSQPRFYYGFRLARTPQTASP